MLSLLMPLCAAVTLDNWMGDLYPVIADKTLLDLSFPGTHDTMTYDLSLTISDDAEDMSPAMADFLHDFSHILPSIPSFIREQSQTQDYSIIDQLNGGVRFIDFRVIYTRGPKTLEGKEWYALHMMESKEPCLTYLKDIKTWMDAHPKEILTFWWTRHGGCQSGQFPKITDKEMETFFNATVDIFGDMIWDTSVSSANETTVAELIQRNHRVLIYAAEGSRFFGKQTRGYDGCAIDNKLGGGVDEVTKTTPAAIVAFSDAQGVINQDKSESKFYLRSMATSGLSQQVSGAAKEKYLFDKHAAKACAKAYHIPGLDDWCPPTLVSQSRLANYYNQIALETSIIAKKANHTASRFPNAIYIDDVSTNGTIITGLGDDSTEGYAYSATVVLSNVLQACGEKTHPECADLVKSLEALRALHPFKTWDDEKHGRKVGWPVTP